MKKETTILERTRSEHFFNAYDICATICALIAMVAA